MPNYVHDVVLTKTGETVALKFVESITVPVGQDETADKLRADVTISIRTISGAEYEISVIDAWSVYVAKIHLDRHAIGVLAQGILDRWSWMIKDSRSM
jgi:hypothetical protein